MAPSALWNCPEFGILGLHRETGFFFTPAAARGLRPVSGKGQLLDFTTTIEELSVHPVPPGL